jgi:aliphatic nitrilase
MKNILASTIVKAAAVQISPVLYSRQGTVEKVVKKIRELGKQGVQFATFPETIVPYYPYFSFVQPSFAMGKEHQRLLAESVTVPSAETQAIAEAALEANMVVSIGVNERDGSSIYNTQLLFNADGTLIQHRRKITPTYHERMIWGQGDGSGLRAVDSAVGRIGQLACWEHYLPLARYALIADGEQIHSAMYPGSFPGPLFAEQTEINIRS